MVGARGFEPPTLCTPCRCATRLRYAPKPRIIAARLKQPASAEKSAPQQLENAFEFLAEVGEIHSWLRAGGFGWFRDQLIETIARTTDRKALIVKQLAYTADKQYFVVLVIASVAASLDGFE